MRAQSTAVKPAADDHHVALDGQRLAVVEAFHEPQALVADARRQAVQFQHPRPIGPGGQQHRIVLPAQLDKLRGIDFVLQLDVESRSG